MVRKKKEPNRIDNMLDDLLAECQGPEDILGESGLLKQLSTRLVGHALVGELSHHLAHDETGPEGNSARRNSRNGYSKKTANTQSDTNTNTNRNSRNGYSKKTVQSTFTLERCKRSILSRNGYSKKTVQSTQGDLELAIPRDRNGDFDPILVPKHQRRLCRLEEKILAVYAQGISTRDISAQLEELYGANVSASLISEVTDTVSEDVKAWQC